MQASGKIAPQMRVSLIPATSGGVRCFRAADKSVNLCQISTESLTNVFSPCPDFHTHPRRRRRRRRCANHGRVLSC